MTKYQTAESYPAEPVELTPSRRRLGELIDARDTAAAESEMLSGRIAKLARAATEIVPLQDALNVLNSAESAAMLAWSEGSADAPPPVADTAKRAEIESKIAAVRAAINAANGATVSVESQMQRVNSTFTRLTPLIAQPAANVVVEEAEKLFDELPTAIAAVESVRGRLKAARAFMIRTTEPPAGQVVGPVSLPFERFDRKFELASARPTTIEDASEWTGFASRLAGDATATL